MALPRGRKGVLLDNCAGDGRAASHLARAWNCRAYLVEPNPHRARLCRQRRDAVVVRGRAEALAIRGTPSVWYFNPPFDPDDGSGRLERALFERSVRYAVGERTVGVLILPLRSLLTTDLMAQIVRRFETVRVRGFPAGVFKAYRQVVVLGIGRRQPWAHDNENAAGQASALVRKLARRLRPIRAGEFTYALHPGHRLTAFAPRRRRSS